VKVNWQNVPTRTITGLLMVSLQSIA